MPDKPELTREEIDRQFLSLLMDKFGYTREQAIRELEGPKCPYIPYEGQFDVPWTPADVERADQAIQAAIGISPKPKPYIPSFSAYERAKKLCQKKQ